MSGGVAKENTVTRKISAILKAHAPGVSYYRPVPSQWGARFLDYVCCGYGYYFAIEAKRPTKKATPLQYNRLKEIETAHGATFTISGLDGVEYLDQWLDWCRLHPVKIDNWPRIPDR